MKKNSILVILILSVCFSCNRKNSNQNVKEEVVNETTNQEVFTIKGMEYVVKVGQGYDSQVGRIITTENKFSYDYGWYSNEGPVSLIDNFKQTFKAYHHQAFFMAVGMDPKTFPIFKDEADIIQVRLKQKEEKDLMFECENCNVVAEIDFKEKIWYFPYQEGDKLVNSSQTYDFTYLEDSKWNYKIYRSLKDKNDCGLYAYPKDRENSNRISVTCQQIGNSSDAEKLLLLFRMKSE